MRKRTTTKKKPATKRKPTTQSTRKFFIKVPVEVSTAAQERKIKSEARKSFKGATFTKK